MGIKFEEKRKIFHLFTSEYSYYIHVNKLNYLMHLYDGKYLNDISKERASERYIERYSYLNILNKNNESIKYDENAKQVLDESYYFSFMSSKFEVSSFGKADKRGAHTIIVGEDNLPITNFLYVTHEIIKGPYIDEFKEKYPHVKFINSDCQTLIITLKEEYKDVYLKLYYEVSEKYNSIVRFSKIINKSKENIIVKKISALEIDIDNSDYEIMSLHGSWSNDRQLEYIPLNHSIIKISENHGARGFYYNPAIALKKKDATYDHGEVYGFNIVWSGDFSYEFKVDEVDQTRLLVGFNEETFSYLLKENEEFNTFEVIQVFTSNGINEMSHIMHTLINERIRNESFKFDKDYILVNSWEAYYFDFDTEKIKMLIEKAKSLNINLVVIDDGWFGKRNKDNSSLGDWKVNESKINLKEVIAYASSLRVDIGLWIEPEMVSPDSNLFREHPEFALIPKYYKTPTLQRNQLVLDLTKDEVIDYIFNELKEIFDNYNIKYVKWDFNRYLSESYSSSLTKERINETSYLFTLGSYKLFSLFKERYPNILLESCASGGGRFDLGMAYYSPWIWGSDETDISLRSMIQFSYNIFYPLSLLGAHISARPLGTITDKGCLAMFGTFGYELDLLKLNEKEDEEVKFLNGVFSEFHSKIIDGDYYTIYDPFAKERENSNYVSWNIVSKDKKTCALYFMLYKKESTKARYIKVKGIHEDKYYFNSLTNEIFKGAYYMNLGINLSAPLNAYQSAMIIFVQVDDIRANIYRKSKQLDQGSSQKDYDDMLNKE